jgi:NAD(P)-dependent dehydrogenase (short-subunit alcohol dehydrogenase family)
MPTHTRAVTVRNVVITGVSSGIGRAAAEDLAAHDFRVFGSVRREADAAPLAAALGARFEPLVCDVTDASAVQAAAERVRGRMGGEGLHGLVNNAGIAVVGPLLHLTPDEMRRQMEVNLIGALHTVQAFFPLLRPAHAGAPGGRIVNVSSVSGRFAMPFLGPYAASKHALEAFSDSLRRELLMYGVDVIVIEPGRIRTPIWDKVADAGRFAKTDYGPILERALAEIPARNHAALPATVVARAIRRALTTRRPRVRYALPDRWWLGWFLPRRLPARWVDRLVAAGMRKARRA